VDGHLSNAATETEREFISRVSHDLRTPLAAIKASIGVVLANEPAGTPEPLSRMFRNIDRAADQLNAMIANLSESMRLRMGPEALNCQITELNELMHRVARLAEPGTRRLDQKIALSIPKRPCLAMVDAPRMERALLNLLDNAQKHGPTGGTIRFELGAKPKEAVFTVADQGPGVATESLELIFTGKHGASSDSGRVGLGLPVAKMVAELHGGRIWLEPGSPAGTVFHIALPTVTSRSTPAAATKDGTA